MPQMSPMNWMFLYIMFTLILLMSIMKIFYSFKPLNMTNTINYTYKYFFFPWSW